MDTNAIAVVVESLGHNKHFALAPRPPRAWPGVRMAEMRNTYLAVLLMVLLASMFIAQEAQPAGLVTHGEVSQRAVWSFASSEFPIYSQYLSRHQDALQAGTVFPDWGYAFGYHGESEEAHWSPFIEAAAAHLHAHYPKPWDEETEKLSVFILGLMCHSVADISWHSLEMDQGFLDAMGEQDFHGSFSDAHDLGDTGGDVVCAHELDLSWMASSWYVPVVDMARVYNELGYDRVTPAVLARYTFLLFLAAHVERSGAGVLFPTFAAPSPFLVEQLQDYFIGGLDDMAVHTSWRWHDVIDWMENGVPGLRHGIGGFLVREDGQLDEVLSGSLGVLPAGDLDFSVETTDRGVIFSLHPIREMLPPVTQRALDPLEIGRSILYEVRKPYAYLGTSLATGDFNQDGMDDLAIGAPGYGIPGQPQRGAVYVMYGRQEIAGQEHVDLTEDSAHMSLLGADDYGRFGWALAAVDINADGVDDLAVSAPTTGAQDLSYRGKVFVYLGDAERKALSTGPGMIITADEVYTNLGWSLASGDCDRDGHDDLIIGAPFAAGGGEQRGLAAVFLSSPRRAAGTASTLDNADWTAAGAHEYDWFGYHLVSADMKDKGRFILIGAPGTDRGTQQCTGTLYGFDMSSIGQTSGEPLPVFSITGSNEFDKTGSSFAYGDPFGTGHSMVAVSSPTQNVDESAHAGSIVLLPVDGLHGEVGIDSLSPHTTFLGNQPFARLGWQVGFSDVDSDGLDDLWVMEPWRETDAGVEAGAAYLWLGGDSFPTGVVNNCAESAFWNISHTVPRSLFGAAVAFPDFNGDGAKDVAISARRASSLERSAGAVYLLIAPSPAPHAVTPTRAEGGGCGCAHFGPATRPWIGQMVLTGLLYCLPLAYIVMRRRYPLP